MKLRTRRWVLLLGAGLAAAFAGPAKALFFVEQHGTNPIPPETSVSHGWPKGTLEVVNHPTRRQGWSAFFSECPNDVEQFGYRFRNTEEANGLLETLGRMDGKVSVVLTLEREYRWDSQATEGYDGHFLLGSQKILDEWWRRLPGGKFGVTTYPAPPTAMPPKLTLYAGSGRFAVSQLRIPARFPVLAVIREEDRQQPELAAVARQIDALAAARRPASP